MKKSLVLLGLSYDWVSFLKKAELPLGRIMLETATLTLFYRRGVKSTPLADYHTPILGGCPEWTDF